MHKGVIIKLELTPEQEVYCKQTIGTTRWLYNDFLSKNFQLYEYFLENNTGPKHMSVGEFRNEMTKLGATELPWLLDTAYQTRYQAIKDADRALWDFIKGKRGKPHFKVKGQAKESFYVRYDSLKRMQGGVKIERLGFIKTCQPLPQISKKKNYSNPRIIRQVDGWYLSLAIEIEPLNIQTTGEIIGIDLGIKELAVYSNNTTINNINKTKKMKYLKRKLRREQKKLSRKREHNIKFKSYHKSGEKKGKLRKQEYERDLKDCKNYQKQKKVVGRLYKRMNDIRNNHLHQTTTHLVKNKPSRIIVEDLNVKGMLRNRHLVKAISEQKFYEFIRQLEYKCEYYSIEFIKADRWYASSKICSCCGNKKDDLKLKDRIYTCNECGLAIDRDLNAAINLAHYQV